MERDKSGDRPALMYEMAGKETSILQQVGFLDSEGVPFQVCIEWAIEHGLIKEREIRRESMPLEDGWRRLNGGT